MMSYEESCSFKIEEILAKHNAKYKKSNPCPVGKKFISDVQRRLACGLDVTNRSLNSTVETENDSMEESWLDRGSSNRLELYKRRRSMNRKILKSMGGDFNQFTMTAPKFNPRIIDLPSCSEDSEDDEPVKKTSKEVEKKEEEQLGGSQGRIGQGCSTPRHMNNTMAMLKQIDVSAVSFNSTNIIPQVAALPPAENNTVELVEEKDSTLEVLEVFKRNPKPAPRKSSAPSKEKSPTKIVPKKEPEISTETVQKDGGTFTIEEKEGTYTIEAPKDATKTRKSISNLISQTMAKADGVNRMEPAERCPIVHPVIKVKVARKSEVTKRSSLAQGPKNTVPNKRQSVQFATIPSPAGRSFGFSSPRQTKKQRILESTPGRFGTKSPEQPISLEENNGGNQTSYMDAETFYQIQETPKSARQSRVSFAASKPVVEIIRQEDHRKSHAIPPRVEESPRYARPTIASTLKSPIGIPLPQCNHNYRTFNATNYTTERPNYSDVSSTFVECDPNEFYGEAQLQSGYRPRRDVKDAIQSRLRSLNAGLDDNKERTESLEERRRNFLAKRLERQAALPLPPTPTPAPPTPKMIPEKSTMEVLEQHIDNIIQSNIPKEEFLTEPEDPTEKSTLQTALDAHLIQTEIDAEFDKVTAEMDALPLPSTPTSSRRPRTSEVHFDEDFGTDPYENDDADSTADEGIIIRQSQKMPLQNSIFSATNETPPGGYHKKKRVEIEVDDENSIIEDHRHQIILKPRKIIRPETSEDNGVRRSKRVRIAPLRTWMGEQAVYKSSPGGSQRLVGAKKVVVKDPRYVKTLTTDPVKALDRERKNKY